MGLCEGGISGSSGVSWHAAAGASFIGSGWLCDERAGLSICSAGREPCCARLSAETHARFCFYVIFLKHGPASRRTRSSHEAVAASDNRAAG